VKLATRSEAVKALGLDSPRALDRLIERGAPAPLPGKRGGARYDVQAIEAWRAARKARTAPALDLATERAALARVQRQLAHLKLREARGELIRSADAAAAQRATAGAVRAQLLAVPRRAVLAGLPREHEPLVKRLIAEALRELSEVRTLAGLTQRDTEDAV
jgi:phage terminase Nu1 subunit (DNA packaging protein)